MSGINRAELKILKQGTRIKTETNSIFTLDQGVDFYGINAPVSMVYYKHTQYEQASFDRGGNPYIDEDGNPEMLTIVRISFNGETFETTAAQIGKGTDVNGDITWFTDDGTENGKPNTEKYIEWLDNNL